MMMLNKNLLIMVGVLVLVIVVTGGINQGMLQSFSGVNARDNAYNYKAELVTQGYSGLSVRCSYNDLQTIDSCSVYGERGVDESVCAKAVNGLNVDVGACVGQVYNFNGGFTNGVTSMTCSEFVKKCVTTNNNCVGKKGVMLSNFEPRVCPQDWDYPAGALGDTDKDGTMNALDSSLSLDSSELVDLVVATKDFNEYSKSVTYGKDGKDGVAVFSDRWFEQENHKYTVILIVGAIVLIVILLLLFVPRVRRGLR